MVDFEKSWHYHLLIRKGVSPDDARIAVSANMRRVRKEKAIEGAIFDKENDAILSKRAGLESNLFSNRN